jgi:hypothetical protein
MSRLWLLFLAAVLSCDAAELPRPGAAAALTRAPPDGLPVLPLRLVSVQPGRIVTEPASAVEAAQQHLARFADRTQCTVDPSNGRDTTERGNRHFASLAFAVRVVTDCTRIYATRSFVEEPFDLRYTDPSQSRSMRLKVIYANGNDVTIRSRGPDIATTPLTPDATRPQCYCTPAGWLNAHARVTRVMRKDLNDTHGFSAQFRQYGDLAALADATSPGWSWDAGLKRLCLNTQGDANALRTRLATLFVGSDGNSRILSIGAAIAFDHVRFEGVQFVTLDGGGRRPSIWTNGIVQLWAPAKGYDGTQAGDFVETNAIVFASRHDGRNAYARSETGPGLILTVNSQYVNSGDLNVFPPDDSLQGISAHGGSHHVSWGSRFTGNNGQGVGDGIVDGSRDITWLVGCVIGPQASKSANNMHMGGTGSGSRTVYLDSNRSTNVGPYDLLIDRARVYVHDTPLARISGGVTAEYRPDAPPQ